MERKKGKQMTSTIVANMRHAVRNHEITFIGGGEFSPSEIKEAADLIEDCGRLQPMNAELLDALESLLNIEGPAAVGAQLGAFHGLDVPYHFNKARAVIAKAKGQS